MILLCRYAAGISTRRITLPRMAGWLKTLAPSLKLIHRPRAERLRLIIRQLRESLCFIPCSMLVGWDRTSPTPSWVFGGLIGVSCSSQDNELWMPLSNAFFPHIGTVTEDGGNKLTQNP